MPDLHQHLRFHNSLFSGLSGYLPLHPMTYITAKRNRIAAAEAAKKAAQEAEAAAAAELAANASPENPSSPEASS